MDRKVLALAAALASIALASCSRSDDATPPAANTAMTATPAPRIAPSPTPSPSAASPTPAAVANESDAPPKEAARTRDERMLDDASATGMTARSSRDAQADDNAADEQTENE